jgi:ribosomal protein S27AE
MTKPASITCPKCGAVSYSVNDIKHGYCGRCHDFTTEDAQMVLGGSTAPWTHCPECGALDSHTLRCSWWHRSRYYRDDWKPMPRLPEPAITHEQDGTP